MEEQERCAPPIDLFATPAYLSKAKTVKDIIVHDLDGDYEEHSDNASGSSGSYDEEADNDIQKNN